MRRSLPWAAALGGVVLAGPAAAQVPSPLRLAGVELSGDLRLRLEEDWDAHTAAGAERRDRGRARVRARLAAATDLGGGFRLQARVRTGAEHSQQGANVTFADIDGNPVDIFKVSLDHASLAWKRGAAGVEVGRMAFPFLTSNEYFWDADVAPLGAAASVAVPVAGGRRLRLIGGGFALPVGLADYSGRLYAGQAVVEGGAATLAAGLFRFQADRRDPDRLLLLDGNGSRDYSVLALNGQYRLKAAGRPLMLTADLYRNLQGYAADPDPVSRAYRRERTGFVLGGAWGDTAKARHLQLGYRYFRIEKLAIDASYSHDDIGRYGTASQVASSDLTGHDLYANFALTRHLVAGARMMMTHRLTTREDDKRARLDLTYSF